MRFTTTFAVIALLAAISGTGLAACGSEGDNGGGAYGGASETSSEEQSSNERTEATEPSTPAVETIAVRDGKPVGGVAELEFSAGEEIRFKVSSDLADEVHVHGYDQSKQVDAGGTVSFSFPAELEGIFEVELEERAEQIAELRVNP